MILRNLLSRAAAWNCRNSSYGSMIKNAEQLKSDAAGNGGRER